MSVKAQKFFNSGKKRGPKYEAEIKKIRKMYQNYGLNTANMSEDELDRLYQSYKATGKDLDKDLKDSEKFLSVFGEDIIG
jgi:hypothetical protein